MAAILGALTGKGDQVLEGPVEKPLFGTFWSLTHGTAWPPAPCLPGLFEDAPIYSIVGSPGHYVYDDSENPNHTSLFSTREESSLEPSIDPPSPPPLQGFGTNLWITITNFTGSAVPLSILNTTNGLPYEVLSATNLLAPLSNWVSECIVVGLPTNTPAFAEMGDRTNQLFFRAHQWDGNFTYGVPTNGQIFLQVQSSPIQPVINGVTNTLSTFYSNWVMILPTNLLTVNLGYDANDGGITNAWITTNAQQGVLRLEGFSKTLTNLCISYNPITNLNVSGWPALKSVDAWHCTNNLTVSLTNCPQLARTCFEAIQFDGIHGLVGTLDYSGCAKIAEVRAADNRLSDISFGNGAGPEVWHLCIHNNSASLPAFMDFNSFPSMRELWIWGNNFNSALNIPNSTSTNLTSVEAFGNHFPSANFTGQTNLDHALLSGNMNLTNITITGCSKLRLLDAGSAGLSSGAVDSIFGVLDTVGIINNGANSPQVYLNGGTNGVPSVDGQRHAANLINKGWTVFYNLPPAGTPEISAITVSSIGSNYVTLTWITDVGSDSTVYYSTSTSSYFSTNVNGSSTSHSITVVGLIPATNYDFYVQSSSGSYTGTSADYQFTTRGGSGIYFAHTSSSVSMQIAVTGSPSVTWLWGDGSATLGSASVVHSFTSNTTSSVVVTPASALTGFGLTCGSTTALDQVVGLTNYPNLQELNLYQSGLTNLSLAGCSNLVSIALVATSPSSAVENAWFNDLTAAQPVMPSGSTSFSCGNSPHVFYFPTNPGTNSTSAVACSNLTHQAGLNGHWDLQHYP